jgi:hypothetical protein
MVHQDAHGLIKLAILIWLVNLHVMLTRLLTYLFTYHSPTYYLSTYLPKYLFIYLSIYLPTNLLPTNLLFIYIVCILIWIHMRVFFNMKKIIWFNGALI